MDLFFRTLNGLRSLLFRHRKEADLATELRHHIELETEKNVRSGMPPSEAKRRALVDFGGVERFREQAREARGTTHFEDLFRDLRYAGRRLVRAPGSSLAVILCLGLGLGATAGVFSFFFGIVLRPLPFDDSDRLAILFETAPGFTRASPSFTDFEGWRDNSVAFPALGAYSRVQRTITGPEGPEILDGTRVSHDLFQVLGVQPQLGRGFVPEDDGPGAAPSVILGHRMWEERFGGVRDVLGAALTLDGAAYTVVGVMPSGFAFPEEARFWVPLRTSVSPRGGSMTAVLGRFGPGVTLEGARSDMDRVAAIMRDAYPEANAQREIAVRPLEDDFLYGLKTPVTLFLLVAGFVLLLATANVANLLMAQGTARTREMVVRTAMGAGRPRILRQLVTESLLLAGAGGVVGVFLGVVGRNFYLSFLPEDFPYYLRFDMDAPVLGLLAVVTLAVGVLFGLVPALETTRVDLFAGLRSGGEGASTAGIGRNRFRASLMALQTGLALAVLLGAGMMAQSLGSLRQVTTGVESENLLTMRVSLSEIFRDDQARQLLAFDEIRERIEGLPGVAGAAVISNLPIAGGASGTFLHVEGTEAPPEGQEPWIINKQSQPGYFETMGIRLIAGRDFTASDGAEGSPSVVIVNESFARRYWPEGEALGRRIKYGRPESEYPWMEVVGVAADVRHFGPDSPIEMGIYEPLRQFPYWRENLVVRTASDPAGLIQAVVGEIHQVDSDAPVYSILTMDELLFRSYWRPVVMARLLWVFSGFSLLLAALGVYGVVAFSTALRRREFGIRMALGAERSMVLGTAVRTTASPALAGLAGGLILSLVGMRFVRSLLYGVDSLDPGVAIVGVLAMMAVALTATLIPARKAAGADPADVLKGD